MATRPDRVVAAALTQVGSLPGDLGLIGRLCTDLEVPALPPDPWELARQCADTLISVPAGVTTPGALLFRWVGASGVVPLVAPKRSRVAISIGDGRIVEQRLARPTAVYPGAADGRWSLAATIPGVLHSATPEAAGPVGRGDRSPDVAAVQAALNRAFPPLEVDGTLDDVTEARIRAWQAATGRPITGIADSELLDHLHPAEPFLERL